MTIYFTTGCCYLGHILLAKSNDGVCAIMLGDTPEKLAFELKEQFPNAASLVADKHFEEDIRQLIGCLEKPSLKLNLTLDIQGTPFQQRVWTVLQEIAPGATLSYTDIAALIDSPKAVRAVASACGANKLAFAIPCHRVISKDGSLGGYRWGIERKRLLLETEQKL